MEEYEKRRKSQALAATKTEKTVVEKAVVTVGQANVKVPEDLKRHTLLNYPLQSIMPYVNRQMLIGHHLGLKGKLDALLEKKDEKALQLTELVDSLYEDLSRDQYQVNGVYQFFPAQSDGNKVIVYNPDNQSEILEVFDFPRQNSSPFLCLADYLKPVSSGEMDYVAFYVVTAGKGIRKKSDEWKEKGEFLKSHAIQSIALETAEGFAERMHQVIRDKWGISDHIDMTMKERFAAKYIGQRFSFGYPACPNLEDQEKLFRLLKPEDIGVKLTDGCMMEPEASVSAIVFAHPEARYFNVER